MTSVSWLYVCYANLSHSSYSTGFTHRSILALFFHQSFYPVYSFPPFATTPHLLGKLFSLVFYFGELHMLHRNIHGSQSFFFICVLGTQFYSSVRHWRIECCSWHRIALGHFFKPYRPVLLLSIIACIHYAHISWYAQYLFWKDPNYWHMSSHMSELSMLQMDNEKMALLISSSTVRYVKTWIPFLQDQSKILNK